MHVDAQKVLLLGKVSMNKCLNCKPTFLCEILFQEKCHMADRLYTSAFRERRPKMRSAHPTSHVPVVKPKVSRPRSKSAHTSKISDSSTREKKTMAKAKQVKVIEVDSNLSDN